MGADVSDSSPLVSVIMAVHNGAPFLARACESILTQSIKDIELVIVDDASTDDTPKILSAFKNKDGRVRVITNVVNRERCVSRNIGIHAARSNFVANIDADDVALVSRLEKQFEFMTVNSACVLCGSQGVALEQGEYIKTPILNDDIHAALLFRCCFIHSSVMFNKKLLLEHSDGYGESCLAEDFELFARISASDGVMANVPDVLCACSLQSKPPSRSYMARLQEAAGRVYAFQLERMGISATRENVMRHMRCVFGGGCPTGRELFLRLDWLLSLVVRNRDVRVFSESSLLREVDCYASSLRALYGMGLGSRLGNCLKRCAKRMLLGDGGCF